jgi:uncharacterized protein YyaL (SSP411 family)
LNLFFDDNGWFGLAYFDAYRATHDRRFLSDSLRAYRFIKTVGWSKSGGGIWWDTAHEWRTIEPLAAEALLGAELYRTTHATTYLRETRLLISWADHHSWNRHRALYQRNPTSNTVMNYAEGMMISADAILCRTLRTRHDCQRAEQLATASARAFPLSYHWSPETDVIYLRGLLQLWAVDHNARWYRVADYWAHRAVASARDSSGLFMKRWDGGTIPDKRLLTPGGTLMLLAALTVLPGPA